MSTTKAKMTTALPNMIAKASRDMKRAKTFAVSVKLPELLAFSVMPNDGQHSESTWPGTSNKPASQAETSTHLESPTQNNTFE